MQKQESVEAAFLHLLLSYHLKLITYLKIFDSYEKKIDLWVYMHPALKRLINELRIVILIIVASVSNVFATSVYSPAAKFSPDMETNINNPVPDIKTLLTTETIDNTLMVLPSETGSQQIRISGTVTDASTKESMPGVNVLVKGTTLGVLTDANGNYSVTVPDKNAILVFSFIGMSSQEIPVTGRTLIDVVLKEEAIGLEEVVVIGYGTQKKVNVIGSVTTVTNEQINASPVSMVSNAIAGRMPGVIVQQSMGEPGNNASTILIRGQATLGNNSPLIVVDGVPDRDMNSLLPADIESITVLKDASAAIYGARAANGVILITTKRGKVGAPITLNYGFYQGWQSPTQVLEMCDAATYAQMIREMQSYRNVAESNMMFSLDDIEKYKSGKYPWTHPNTDWVGEALKKYSQTSSHDFSISGGNQAVAYYGSFGTKSEDGIYKKPGSYYKRYNLKANIDAKINKHLSLGLDISGSQENSMLPTRGQEGIFGFLHRSRPTSPAYWPNGLPGPDVEDGDNPVVTSGFDPGFNDNKTYRLNTKLSATLNVPGVSGLTLSGYFVYDKYFKVKKLFETPFTLYSLDKQAYLNAGNTGAEDGSAFIIPSFPKGQAPEPRLTDSYGESNTKIFNVKANYDKTIAGVHNISVFISMESSDYLSKGIEAFRRYFISDKIPYLFAGSTTSWSNDGSVGIDSRLNYFGRLMYNFKETYLFQFSLRRDGSLRFSKDSGRWGTFPSVLAGWRISNENFWKNNIKFINYFKLKASYGQMGNDQVDAFQYLAGYEFGNGPIFGSSKVYQSGLVLSGAPNPFITWEVANVYNAGFESTFLNSKVTFNADFFYQRRSKILVERNASVPNFTGISLPDENFGIVDNKGFELELGYNDRKGDFAYNINGNIAFARNKIIEFDEPAVNVTWQRLTGHPQGTTLLYKAIGVFNDQTEVDAYPHVSGARPGDIIIEDYDKDGKITDNDRILFDKTAVPELTYGMNFNLSYKRWELNALIQGTGTTMRNCSGAAQSGTSGNYLAFDAADRWTVDNINGTNPRAFEREEEYWRDDYETDYRYIKSGYGRLKNIQLTYTIPERLLNVISVKDAKIYCSGENLLLIYNQNKLTYPEISDFETYPIMKTFVIGIKVAF